MYVDFFHLFHWRRTNLFPTIICFVEQRNYGVVLTQGQFDVTINISLLTGLENY